MGRFFRLFLVPLLALSTVLGQNAASPQLKTRPSEPPPPPPGGTDRQITLDVQVADKSGAPVRGLRKQDFALLDDKQPKNILSFHAVDGGAASNPPIEIVLVVDAVNASLQAVAYDRVEVKKFPLQNGGKLAQPVSLAIFSEAGTKILDGSSRDGNALAALSDQYTTGLRSRNRDQWERFDMSMKAMTLLMAHEGARPGRKVMIWLSPGWPLLSGSDDIKNFPRDQRHIFNSIVETSTGLRQARITLYSIDPLALADAGGGRTSDYKEFLKAVVSPEPVLPGDLALQVLAVQSGGRVFNSNNDLEGALANCAVDANAFYVLSFDAAQADRPDEYHSLGVTVDKPGIEARTRTGYYAQP
jgi:VWFA-related protein